MISFLLQEGVITIGTVSGIFTALLMNSFKNNIIDPIVEKTVPTVDLLSRPIAEIVDDFKDDGKLNNSNKKQSSPQNNQNNIPAANVGNQFGGHGKNEIRWKVFLRDFITWLIIVFILYMAWKHILLPIKLNSGINTPTTNTQFFTMQGMGKGIKK